MSVHLRRLASVAKSTTVHSTIGFPIGQLEIEPKVTKADKLRGSLDKTLAANSRMQTGHQTTIQEETLSSSNRMHPTGPKTVQRETTQAGHEDPAGHLIPNHHAPNIKNNL